MKRIVLFTFTMLLGIFCYAQSEHLKFWVSPKTQLQAYTLKHTIS